MITWRGCRIWIAPPSPAVSSPPTSPVWQCSTPCLARPGFYAECPDLLLLLLGSSSLQIVGADQGRVYSVQAGWKGDYGILVHRK